MNGIHAAFTGRVSGDPEQRYTAQGKSLLKFSALVDENTTGAQPHYVNCTAWEADAERLADVLKKGVFVYCEGRLKLDRWVAQDGTPRSGLSCSCWRVDLIGQLGKSRPPRQPTMMSEEVRN